MKSLVICADDYALNTAVSQGIRDLVQANRISAVSCMTNSPSWMEEAALLKQLPKSIEQQVDIGLHFNLTHSFTANKSIDLSRLIMSGLFGKVDKQWVAQELNTQLDNFEAAFGRAPDFVDGHQHVHVFPQIRQLVFAVLIQRYGVGSNSYLRNVNPSLSGHDAKLKAVILNILAYRFSKDATLAGFKLSGDFAGLYSLSEHANFSQIMEGWLKNSQDAMLIMCHPAVYSEASSSQEHIESAELMATRLKEYQFLNSGEFLAICKKYNIKIDKLNKLHHASI